MKEKKWEMELKTKQNKENEGNNESVILWFCFVHYTYRLIKCNCTNCRRRLGSDRTFESVNPLFHINVLLIFQFLSLPTFFLHVRPSHLSLFVFFFCRAAIQLRLISSTYTNKTQIINNIKQINIDDTQTLTRVNNWLIITNRRLHQIVNCIALHLSQLSWQCSQSTDSLMHW